MALVPDSARFSAAVIGKDVFPKRLFVGLNVLLYGRLLLKQRYGFPTVSVRIGTGSWKKIRFNPNPKGEYVMIKVKTFASPLKVFHVKEQLENLDTTINQFIAENNIGKIISVSDTCTTDDTGASIGIIRVVSYQE
jgi:hypothetical protein